MRIILAFIWTAILLNLPLLLLSQTIVKGKTVHAVDGKAAPYVTIIINNEINISDKDGYFEIECNQLDEQTELIAERIGYFTQIQALSKFNDYSNIILKMEERPIVFGEILIEDSPRYSIPQSDEIMDQTKLITQPRDAGDLIRGVNGFGVLKRGSYALEPVFRSFKQEQINVLFDGFIQFNHTCPNRMDPATTHIIPEEIRKIEIVKGPFSVRYGPVMGAILNYLTESALHKKQGFSGSFESGYEFNGEGKSGRGAFGYKMDKFDFYANGDIKDYNDYRSGDGAVVPSAFSSSDYALKLGYNPSSYQRLQIQWKQSHTRDVKYAGLPMDTRANDSKLGAISYKIKDLSASILSLEVKAFGNQIDHVMDNRDRKNFPTVDAVSTLNAETYGGKMELNIALMAKDMLFAGLDYRLLMRDGVRNRILKKNPKTGMVLPEPKYFTDKIWQDSRMSTLGFYLENKYYSVNNMVFTAGLRTDLINTRIDDPAEDFAALYDLSDRQESNISANLSMAWFPKDDLSLQFALGRGVRSASIDERYINHFAVGKDPYELVGNPKLKPEVNNQLEVSLRKQMKNMDIQLNVFYSFFSNLITAAVDTSLTRKYLPWLEPNFAKRYVNVDQAYQTGFELAADYSFAENWFVHGQLAYTYAQNISWDEPISRVSPMEAGLNIKYEQKVWWTSLNGRFVAKQNRVADSFGEIKSPAFNLFDFRAGIKPFKGLNIGMAVSNILDENYVEFLNWSFNPLLGEGLVLEPGRNISLYIKYNF